MNLLNKALAVIVGSFLVGIGVNALVIPHQLMDGGLIGVGLLAKYYAGLKPGAFMILVSIPLFALVFFHNRALFFQSVHGMLVSSLLIDWFSFLRGVCSLPLSVASVVGGAMVGAGIGIMLAYESNTGGTDMVAQILAQRTGVSVALLIFIIDGAIVAASWEAIGGYRIAYSLLTITCGAIATHWFSQITLGRK